MCKQWEINDFVFFEQDSDVPAKKRKESETEVEWITFNLFFAPKMISSPSSPGPHLIAFSVAF